MASLNHAITSPPEAGILFSVKSSPIHGHGVFANSVIYAGTRVVEYRGERISKDESLKRCEAGNPCIFALDEHFDLDGGVNSNPARFINHSCAPNCEAVWIGGLIFIVALRNIQLGEEITFNYGYDLVDYRQHPCHCGDPTCVDYIVAEVFFPTLKARQRQSANEPDLPH
jgi:SET domain-containing protein